jgi:predicted permease
MLTSRRSYGLGMLGRLKPNVRLQAARSELASIAEGIRQEDAGVGSRSFDVRSYRDVITSSVRLPLLALSGAVLLVLLIACVNVANLQLARHLARRQELAVRAALGAERGRLVRQTLTEGAMLSLAGGLAGLSLAALLLKAVHHLPPNVLPRADEIQFRVPVLAMLMAFAVVATILSSLAPALWATDALPQEVLREASGGSGVGMKRSRLAGWMVAGEVAISAVLAVGTGLMFRTLYNLQHIHFGFDLEQVTTFTAKPGDAPGMVGFTEVQKRGGVRPPESIVTRVYEPIRDRLRQLPGVIDVAFGAWMPFDSNTMGLFFQIPGHRVNEAHGENVVQIQMVSPGYARAIGTPLVKGRAISDDDTADTPFVATVNETFVRRFLPGQNPLGLQIDFRPGLPPYTIVGVLGDATQHDLLQPPKPQADLPYRQIPTTSPLYFLVAASGTNYVLRTGGDVELTHAIHEVFRQTASEFALEHFRNLRVALDDTTFNQRLGLYLTGCFAGVAVLMVLAGLYGVLSQLVGQRQREIGIRMALGADRRDVLKLVLGQGMAVTLLGVAVGLAGASGLTRYLSSLLYGVRPTDALTFVAVALLLTAVALLACYIPARRATKVDPMVALRYE